MRFQKYATLGGEQIKAEQNVDIKFDFMVGEFKKKFQNPESFPAELKKSEKNSK